MKKSFFILLVCILNLNSFASCYSKQNSNGVISMLKEFYIAYNTAWSSSKGYPLIKKLDSLQSKYCTISYRRELKKEFKEVGLDHDELVNDAATDIEHLNTLNIIKDRSKVNEYIVSYIVVGKDASNKPLQERIVIHVIVTKEAGAYKIAAIKNGSYSIIPNK